MTIRTKQPKIFLVIIIGITINMVNFYGDPFGKRMFFIPSTL